LRLDLNDLKGSFHSINIKIGCDKEITLEVDGKFFMSDKDA
jgi:hypothetical protein